MKAVASKRSAAKGKSALAGDDILWNQSHMFAWDAGFIAACLPTKSKVPPSRPEEAIRAPTTLHLGELANGSVFRLAVYNA